MKAAPDRCRISLRTEEYTTLINALLRQPDPQESDLLYKLQRAQAACQDRGDASKTEADLCPP